MLALSNSLTQLWPTTLFGRVSAKEKERHFKWIGSPESPLGGKASPKPAEGFPSTPPPDTTEPDGSKNATSARLAAGKEKEANDERGDDGRGYRGWLESRLETGANIPWAVNGPSVHNPHIDTAAAEELWEIRQKTPPQTHAPKSAPGTENRWEAEAKEIFPAAQKSP
jgi:hypothetical protein